MCLFVVNYILSPSETQWVVNTVPKLHFKWLRDTILSLNFYILLIACFQVEELIVKIHILFQIY